MLDQFSLLCVYSAMAVYTIALIAFTVDLSRRSAHAQDPERSGTAYGRSPSARVGVALTLLAWMLHLAGDILRGLAAGRVPWANMYEFALTGTLVMATVFLVVVFAATFDVRFLGTFLVGFVVLLLGAATVKFYVVVAPLPPALQSYWLVVHVFVASSAVGFFVVGGAVSFLQLLQTRRERRADGPRGLFATLPDSVRLERFAYRITVIGFVLWTFTLIAGAIWAEKAWGRYWGWDNKEIWTFIVWVVFAGYIHARSTRGWRGVASAWLAIVGFAAVIFNFTVVNIFFAGLHSYSGL